MTNKLPKITKRGYKLIVFENGNPVIVIRPENPESAIKLAEEALAMNNSELFQKIIEEQDYRFRGFLSRNHKIVDENGKYLELIRRGDSFVTANENN